ncbi:MAG: SDR family oxidoreductase [Gammaproteobacteria bacterium]|nr:SDR family oxidoreductase [Gammaproteobacteria bacterium]
MEFMKQSSTSELPPELLLLDARERVALVAGGAGGIGQATVELFLAAGAHVLVADVSAVSDTMQHPRLFHTQVDLTGATGAHSTIELCMEKFGRLDYLVHAMGVTGTGPASHVSIEQWNHVINTNLTSAFLLAQAGYAPLQSTKGRVVFMSSPNGINGGTELSGPAYAAAKAGILNLARYLAKEWAVDRINVNTIIPGTVDTPMLNRLTETQLAEIRNSIPLGRLTTPKEVAAGVAFLCSSHASHITGSSLNISGGRLMI